MDNNWCIVKLLQGKLRRYDDEQNNCVDIDDGEYLLGLIEAFDPDTPGVEGYKESYDL